MQYYNSLKPATVSDVFSSPLPTLGRFSRETNETKARALVSYMITDLLESFNIGKNMSDYQIAKAADLIIEMYYYLKIDDFKLCFNNVIKGKYGSVYDRIDVQTILSWIARYLNERLDCADDISYIEHITAKGSVNNSVSKLNDVYEKFKNK